VDSSVKAFLALEPPPSGPLIGDGNTAHYDFAPVQVVNENFFTIRADQNISDKDKLFGTYSFDNAPSTRPDAFFGNVLLAQSDRRQIAAVEETHTFSASFVNSVRLGYNRSHTQAAGGIKPSIRRQRTRICRGRPDLRLRPAYSLLPGFRKLGRACPLHNSCILECVSDL